MGYEELGMSFEDYQKEPGLNFSTAKEALSCPIKYLDRKENQTTETTPAMELGTLTHAALLEPGRWRNGIYKAPDGIRRGTKAWKEIELAAGSKKIVKAADYDRAVAMAESVRSSEDAEFYLESQWYAPWLSEEKRDILKYDHTVDTINSLNEVSIFWTDPRTGLKLKGRIDCLSCQDEELLVVDLKTSADASPRAMENKLCSAPYHYLLQMAWYCRGVKHVFEENNKCGVGNGACIIAVENKKPYAVGTYLIDMDDIELANRAIDNLLDEIVKIENGELDKGIHYKQNHIYAPDWWCKLQQEAVK